MLYDIPVVRCVLRIQLLDLITLQKQDTGEKKVSPSQTAKKEQTLGNILWQVDPLLGNNRETNS
jgi:hypothetical protein